MPTHNRPLSGANNNNKHYEALVKGQTKSYKNHDSSRNYAFIAIGSTVTVQ